mgnify:CR=1 FL=1
MGTVLQISLCAARQNVFHGSLFAVLITYSKRAACMGLHCIFLFKDVINSIKFFWSSIFLVSTHIAK